MISVSGIWYGAGSSRVMSNTGLGKCFLRYSLSESCGAVVAVISGGGV